MPSGSRALISDFDGVNARNSFAQSSSELKNELRASIEDDRFEKIMKSENVAQEQLRELLSEDDVATGDQMTHLR
jgi:hypothetical protein